MTSASDSVAIDSASLEEPRSRRVGLGGPPPSFQLLPNTAVPDPLPTPPLPSTSPPLPPRSPLRPSTFKTKEPTPRPPDLNIMSDFDDDESTLLNSSKSFASFSSVMETTPRSKRPKTPDKPLPRPPPSPVSFTEEIDLHKSHLRIRNSTLLSSPPPQSKRNHALLELLSTERAYAFDLAQIRNVHMPLALGQPSPFQSTPVTPPSSGSSSRTLSTASDSSNGSTLGPPMTGEDCRIIFNNICELAEFSDAFTGKLEEALGNVLEGGDGADFVGELFLGTIPEMEPLYTCYITKHAAAVDHLNNLTPTPSLVAYINHTRSLAQSLTHAWDLPSLLIKPVQRLLKYSLLLAAIIDETPDKHPDKENLKAAKAKMEIVAHHVNEDRRRREVVKEILAGVPAKQAGDQKAKKKGMNISVAASVSLGRMKSIRSASYKAKEGADASQEAEQVAKMGEELHSTQTFIRDLARDAVRWAESVSVLMENLRIWTLQFGRVIGVGQETKSDAFDAFVDVIHDRILPICKDVSEVIENNLLADLSRLRDSTLDPERLLEAMITLEPLHYGLLNVNVSKTRPPAQLLEASKSYVALRGQLAAELPRYLELLHKGLTATIIQLSAYQGFFWDAIRHRWSELWDALRQDGEMQGEAAETLRVWWGRFAEIEMNVNGLNIVHPIEKRVKEKERARERERELEKERERERERQKEKEKHKDREGKPKTRKRSLSNSLDAMVSTTLAVSAAFSLDPVPPQPSSSKSASSPRKNRSGSSNEQNGGRQMRERKISNESFHSRKSGKSSKSGKDRHRESDASYAMESEETYYDESHASQPSSKPPYYRTQSMPISHPMQLKKSSSQGRFLDVEQSASSSTRSLLDHGAEEEDRGRLAHKPSIRRRITDTLRASPGPSSSRHRRSPSLPSLKGLRLAPPAAAPPQFTMPVLRGSYSRIPALYACKVVHVCEPPNGVSYHDLPFFTLLEHDIYDVLQEAGHPSTHPDLPLYVDDGEDCLLLVRDCTGDIGWALASFLVPVD